MSFSTPALRRLPTAIAILMLGLVGACHSKTEPTIEAGAAQREHASPIPTAGPPAFVGRWSATASSCAHKVWVLTSDSLRSPSVLSCTFEKVSPTDAGYTALSTCTVGKARAPGRLMFTLVGQGAARSLTLNGGPFDEPVGLVRCPAGADAPVQAAATGTAQGG